MDKRQEVEQKWEKHFNKRFEEILKGENGTIKGAFQATGVSDYKSALKEEIEKQLSDMNKNAEGTKQKFYKHNHIFSVIDILQLIDEVTPK